MDKNKTEQGANFHRYDAHVPRLIQLRATTPGGVDAERSGLAVMYGRGDATLSALMPVSAGAMAGNRRVRLHATARLW